MKRLVKDAIDTSRFALILAGLGLARQVLCYTPDTPWVISTKVTPKRKVRKPAGLINLSWYIVAKTGLKETLFHILSMFLETLILRRQGHACINLLRGRGPDVELKWGKSVAL